ncbi:hypothetical protein MMC25_001167 [Agyrium rufum]|nr:hypothetical protein [Agyrium rufum]
METPHASNRLAFAGKKVYRVGANGVAVATSGTATQDGKAHERAGELGRVRDVVRIKDESREMSETSRTITTEPTDASEEDEPLAGSTLSEPFKQSVEKATTKKRKSSDSDTSLLPRSKQAKGMIHEARPPSALESIYNTSRYKKWTSTSTLPPRTTHEIRHFTHYLHLNDYLLYSLLAGATMKDIPTSGIQLDDFTMRYVLQSTVVSKQALKTYWPGEFDRTGFPRSTRMPLGLAAKVWANVGDKAYPDKIDGPPSVIEEGEQGYYNV